MSYSTLDSLVWYTPSDNVHFLLKTTAVPLRAVVEFHTCYLSRCVCGGRRHTKVSAHPQSTTQHFSFFFFFLKYVVISVILQFWKKSESNGKLAFFFYFSSFPSFSIFYFSFFFFSSFVTCQYFNTIGRFLPKSGGGVYSSRWCYGSPAHKYNLGCTTWIVEASNNTHTTVWCGYKHIYI